jgi:hypothetical protein
MADEKSDRKNGERLFQLFLLQKSFLLIYLIMLSIYFFEKLQGVTISSPKVILSSEIWPLDSNEFLSKSLRTRLPITLSLFSEVFSAGTLWALFFLTIIIHR